MNKAQYRKIEEWLNGINQYNATPQCGITRDVFTKEDLGARTYIKQQMKEIGLEVKEDCVGNIFGILQGTEQTLSPVWTGSHIDTVRHGGMFDGTAGVVAGLEALRIIKESGIQVKRNLSVNVYTCEEMGRFGACCIGSRALAGKYQLEDLKNFKEESGVSLYDTLIDLNYNLSEFPDVQKKSGDVYASLELHIEQNDILEKHHLPIGIVTGICAPTNLFVEVTGVQSHAGATSMVQRKDAYMAAAEIALLLEKETMQSTSDYITGTVGKISLVPNAVNVIPGKAIFSIDIRSISMRDKEELLDRLKNGIREIEKERKVAINITMQNHDKPVVCNEHLREILKKCCIEQGIPYMDIVSGAYHDSLLLGEFTKVAMLFVPCKDGISHSEKEWADCKDIARGADILAQALIELGNEI